MEKVEMWPSQYYTQLKYLCDYKTNNYNPIWMGINIEISHPTKGLCAYLKTVVHINPTLAQIAYF